MRARGTIGVLLTVIVVPARAERIVPRIPAETQELAACEETWTWVSPRPQGNQLTDVAFSPTARWVAVGLGGAIAVSADGQEWEPVPSGLPPEADLHAVTWGSGQFVAVGGRDTDSEPPRPIVVTSPDGRTWTRHDPAVARTGDTSFRVVASSGWGLAAVDASGYAWASADGATWSGGTRTVGVSPFEPRDLVWTGRDFVLVGPGKFNSFEWGGVVATSVDGISWHPHLQTRGELNRVASHGDVVVAVGQLGTARRIGEDAWEQGAETPQDVDLQGVAWSGERFVGIGKSGALRTAMESADGGAWAQVAADEDLPDHPANLADGPGDPVPTLVAVGAQGQLATSTDGRAWERRSHSSGVHFYDVAWTGDRWVAVGTGGAILTSPDGLAWARAASPTGQALLAVAAGGGRTVVVGVGEAVTTTDGMQWSLHGGLEATLFGVVWDSRRFLAVGARDGVGFVLASPDGETWTRLDDRTLPELHSLVVADGRFVAYEAWGAPLASGDGVNWTSVDLGDCGDARPFAGAWNGRTLLSVGRTWSWCDLICCGCCPGLALATPDLTTWGCSSSGPELADVAWDGRRFVAVGECGAIVTSPTGEAWTTDRGFAGWSLTAVAASPDAVVIVGPDTVLTRRTCPEPRPVRRRLTSPPH